MIEETYARQKQRNKNFRMSVYQILGLAPSVKDGEVHYTANKMADEILQILEERALYIRL